KRTRDHREHAGARVPRGGRTVRPGRGELPLRLDFPPRRPQPLRPTARGDDGDLHGSRHAPEGAGQPHAAGRLGTLVPRCGSWCGHRHAEEPGAVRGSTVRGHGGRMTAGVVRGSAIIADGAGRFVVDTIEVDPPAAGEVRVAIAAAGVCHTDHASLRWPGPLVMATKARATSKP